MILEFSNVNSIVTMVLGMIITLVLNKTYYGVMVGILGLFMTIQSALLNVNEFQKYSLYSSIPAYVSLILLIGFSFYVLHKSGTVETPQSVFTIIQLTLAVGLSIFLKFKKNNIDLIKNSQFITYLPSVFLLGFIISVSIISDNQPILHQVYTKTMKQVDDYREY